MQTAKIIINALRTLTLRKILRLMKLVLPHPWFSVMALYGTMKTFDLAKKNFPETHSADGVGNAFRHALWPCLIMDYCCKISSPESAEIFSRKMTNLHEELFENPIVIKFMDIHNNEVGYRLFREMLRGIHRQFFETHFFVEKILAKTKTAVKISDVGRFDADSLVYIEDLPEKI